MLNRRDIAPRSGFTDADGGRGGSVLQEAGLFEQTCSKIVNQACYTRSPVA